MKLTVFYGTETGNSHELARKVAGKGEKNGVAVEVVDLATCDVKVFETIDHPFVVIISTWDDGAPPPACVPFVESLETTDLALEGKQYTVLALGDTDYDLFCECGKQVDRRLSELGATPLLPRTDLGADFMVGYIGWSKNFWAAMRGVLVAE
ncbi:MAG: flavodoxin domain-containing protein [Puniceicoccaceae bacterium]